MNKTKITLAAIGGVLLVAVLGAAVFAYLSYADKIAAIEGDDEGGDGLDIVVEKARKLTSQKINPCDGSVAELDAIREEIAEWKNDAFRYASRGDRQLPPTTDAAFKAFIVDDARRLAELPGGTTNKIVDASFEFGPFKPYIAEGRMPETAELQTLQRKWDDVAMLVTTLSGCGVEHITAIDIKAAVEAEKKEGEKPKKGQKKATKKDSAKAAETFAPSSYTYVITCSLKPSALVKVLNTLETSERFAVVNDFTFRHEKDEIAEGLGAEKKRDESSSGGSRRRRRGAVEEVVEQTESAADQVRFTVITDPLADRPLVAKLTITVYDFKSLEEHNEGEDEK